MIAIHSFAKIKVPPPVSQEQGRIAPSTLRIKMNSNCGMWISLARQNWLQPSFHMHHCATNQARQTGTKHLLSEDRESRPAKEQGTMTVSMTAAITVWKQTMQCPLQLFAGLQRRFSEGFSPLTPTVLPLMLVTDCGLLFPSQDSGSPHYLLEELL